MFKIVQNGGHPPYWILTNLDISLIYIGGRTNVSHGTKFHQNWPNSFEDIAIH